MKKNKIKSLKNKAYKLFKKVCFKRDGRECQVKKLYPHLVSHNEIMQVDHFISRANHHFIYEPKNGTVVCSGCNSRKHFRPKGPIDQAIEDIVKMREGHDVVEEMRALERSMKPNENFSQMWWLDEVITKLEAML